MVEINMRSIGRVVELPYLLVAVGDDNIMGKERKERKGKERKGNTVRRCYVSAIICATDTPGRFP